MVPTTNPLHARHSPATATYLQIKDQWGHSECWWCYNQQNYRWVYVCMGMCITGCTCSL